MLVMKFGGTSLKGGARISKAAKLVADRIDSRPVVVVSAMSQVTNTLVELTSKALERKSAINPGLRRLHKLHHQAAHDLKLDKQAETELLTKIDNIIGELEEILKNISSLGKVTDRANDLIICFGERLSIHLLAAALQHRGLAAVAVEADKLIVTDDRFGSASPLLDASRKQTKAILQPIIKTGAIPVITGFMGATVEGGVTTLGRGGSDYSATIIGYCLKADEVWIWTDVDGVMTADPRIVPTAHTVKELSYDEAAELSYFGAKVLHPQTMVPAALASIPIWIKNTLNPEGQGTKITNKATPHPHGAKAMTALRNLSLISVQGKGMQGIYGTAAKIFGILAEQQISVLFISQASSENNISLIVNEHDGHHAVSALKKALSSEIKVKNLEAIQEEHNMTILSVVGDGMRNHSGIVGKIFSSVSHINVRAIAQGSSERNISLVVKDKDTVEGLRNIHDAMHLENGKPKRSIS